MTANSFSVFMSIVPNLGRVFRIVGLKVAARLVFCYKFLTKLVLLGSDYCSLEGKLMAGVVDAPIL